MTSIRRPLLGIIALFIGAVTFDRIALDGATGQTISTAAYLAALALTAAPLAFHASRRTRRVPYLVLSGGAVLGVETFAGRLTGDPYRAAVEACFVVLAAGLGHHLALHLERVEQAVSSVTFGEAPALPLDGRRAANEILGEMARSRRHGRPLSVTVLAPDPASFEAAVDLSHEEVQRALRTRYVHGRLAALVADQLRRSDLLFEDRSTGRFVVVSPETSAEGAVLLAERIRAAVGTADILVGAGQATFPDHALTFEQLVERAQEHLDPAGAAAPARAMPAREGAA
ncbi:MAG: hypothetical protein KQH83_06555 [Actinobacteria bacterium]|nr:hypothetical protein [Actinomycetota bacterium]